MESKWLFGRKQEAEVGPFSAWNITGTYRGLPHALLHFFYVFYTSGLSTMLWLNVLDYLSNVKRVFSGTWKFLNSLNSSSKFQDFQKENGNSVVELVAVPTKITGVHYVQLGIFSSQVFQESPRDRLLKRKLSPVNEMEKHCNIEIAAQVSRVASSENNGDKNYYHMEGLMESPGVGDDGDCFSPLLLNATSVNVEVYYNKAVNYTLMVLLLIRQMEHVLNLKLTTSHAESLFNAFATAAFFKFVVFSIFEMRYLLAIWKATRPSNSGEGWETMRRELSFLYSRFYGILLGGILIMYQFHNYMQPILLLMYSFWIPQIVANVVRDSRKPLHPYYILGMTATRLAIPLYVFGCPHNFMRVEPNKHYFGSRCFVPRQMLPEKYNYHRRFNRDVSRTTDCVICMTAIDLRQHTSDCMVLQFFPASLNYIFSPIDRIMSVVVLKTEMDGYKNGVSNLSAVSSSSIEDVFGLLGCTDFTQIIAGL
ncbi:hypothetical protein [Arabidopsis thaliana]|nr:hypothetical protein [Arabidopsis thaliana]CAB79639.1 hypothetical protein [Arabidopsis thaliana]